MEQTLRPGHHIIGASGEMSSVKTDCRWPSQFGALLAGLLGAGVFVAVGGVNLLDPSNRRARPRSALGSSRPRRSGTGTPCLSS
jgi:hypothetical protein